MQRRRLGRGRASLARPSHRCCLRAQHEKIEAVSCCALQRGAARPANLLLIGHCSQTCVCANDDLLGIASAHVAALDCSDRLAAGLQVGRYEPNIRVDSRCIRTTRTKSYDFTTTRATMCDSASNVQKSSPVQSRSVNAMRTNKNKNSMNEVRAQCCREAEALS